MEQHAELVLLLLTVQGEGGGDGDHLRHETEGAVRYGVGENVSWFVVC